MINVYYGPYASHPALFTWEPLEPLVRSLKEHHEQIGETTMAKCPSFLMEMRNTFVIKSPHNAILRKRGDEGSNIPPTWQIDNAVNANIAFGTPLFHDRDQTWEDETHILTGAPEKIHSITAQTYANGFYTFFADKSLLMTMTPPYLHHGKIFGIAGSFDIGKWFRPLSVATHILDDRTISIRRGEPLAYIRFQTTEKVKLNIVHWNDEAERVAAGTMSSKNFYSVKGLDALYRSFVGLGMRKKLLRLAKQSMP